MRTIYQWKLKISRTSPFGKLKIADNSRPYRIEMNVAHQLQEIGVFVADNGLVAVLKKMSGSLVAQIENHGVTGQ